MQELRHRANGMPLRVLLHQTFHCISPPSLWTHMQGGTSLSAPLRTSTISQVLLVAVIGRPTSLPSMATPAYSKTRQADWSSRLLLAHGTLRMVTMSWRKKAVPLKSYRASRGMWLSISVQHTQMWWCATTISFTWIFVTYPVQVSAQSLWWIISAIG